MSAATTPRAITTMFGGNAIPDGIPWGVTDNSTGLQGTIGVIELSSGYLKMGVTGTGLVCAGRIGSSWDNTGTGHAAGAISVPVRQGVFPWYMGTSSDAITNLNVGAICYIIDNQTVGLTDGGGTRSVAGIVQFVDTISAGSAYPQVYVQMGIYVAGQVTGAAPGGALLISGAQSNTGLKTFSDSTLALNNSGGTFATTFHTAATAARSLTFPDIASATLAALEGTQTWVGVKTWASTSDPLFQKEQDHTLKVDDTTTAATAGGALLIAAGLSGTSGIGGAATLRGGAAGTTGAGGVAALTGGAGGATSGTGGAATVTAGAGTNGNAAGGVASITGGAGNGSGAGGAANHVGGVGGATGAGGAAALTGGAGGATSGTGGAIAIRGGAGSNGNATGGAVAIDGGAKNGSGADGAITIGGTAGAITLGKSTTILTFASKQASGSTTNLVAAATGTAIPVTASGSLAITQNGAETNTLADPTFLGQWIDLFVDTDTSGARVVTAASRINQAANTIITMTEVGDFISLKAITIAGALKWQVTANDGCVLS